MNTIVDATVHYEKAYAAGLKQGGAPAVLQDILAENRSGTYSEYPLGLIQIPLEQIAGTYSEGRKNCFSSHFLPMMKTDSEFASKWIALCHAHLDEGIHTPVIAYEYMNLYYIKEGNKRVSVLSYFEADSIAAEVTRIVPPPDYSSAAGINYEYIDFYHLTRINYIYFSRSRSFHRLLKLVGTGSSYQWTDDDRMDFKSFYHRFREEYNKLFPKRSYVEACDALLTFLSIYDYKALAHATLTEVRSKVAQCRDELELASSASVDVRMDPDPSSEKSSILKSLLPTPELHVGFIHNRNEKNSVWTRCHSSAALQIEPVFRGKIKVHNYFDVTTDTIDAALHTAVSEGCRLIFTTSPLFLKGSMQFKLDHPDIKILNCSLNKPNKTVRTYYGRMYEARFLMGAIAAAMSTNGRIGYISDYPIYSSVSNINAFALGAQMINPDIRIYLNWASLENVNLDEFLWNNQLSIICGKDALIMGQNDNRFGLYKIDNGVVHQLAVPVWNWAAFYEKIITSVLNGKWKADEPKGPNKGVTYWWGLSSGTIALLYSSELPSGTMRLARALYDAISNGTIRPFNGPIVSQDRTICRGVYESLTPDEIINMNWLCDHIIGSIPDLPELKEEARQLTEEQSVKDTAPAT